MSDIEIRYGVKYYAPQYWDKMPPAPTRSFINGFSHPRLPIITNETPKAITLGEWGLIPNWAKNKVPEFRKQANTLNAMIETVATKPSFKDSISRRCLVLVDGFFEYKWLDAKGKEKQLHKIKPKADNLFSLAGLYSVVQDPETGEPIESYTILTTEANTLMAEVHNSKKRMPVVLHRDEENLWLNNDSLEHYRDRSEIELLATPIVKPGQEHQTALF